MEQETRIKLTELGEDSLLEEIHDDIVLLLRYVSNSGVKIPEETYLLLKERNFQNYFKAHEIICETIKPATPETIRYLAKFKHKKSFIFSNIPLVRNFHDNCCVGHYKFNC